MKLLNKVSLVFGSLLLATPALCSFVSCKKDDEIEVSFHISSRIDYVVANGQLQLSLFTTPINISNDELIWEIIDNPYPELIKVSNNGLITVSEELDIESPISVIVKVTWTKKTDVFATKTINVCQESEEDFLGFADSKVTYIDRARNEQSVNILRKENTNEYYTDKPIDLFFSDDEAYFKFVPVIADRAPKGMRFNRVDAKKHALEWRLYNDGDLVDFIPEIYVQHCEYRKDSVIVKFECDDSISLKIDFNAWQTFHSSTDGEVSYVPNAADIPGHTVVPAGEGVFDSQMFCPADGSGTFTDAMTSVYFYRNPYEYLQYDRFEIEKSTNPLIAEAIEVELSEPERIVLREFDDYPAYKLDIKCTFDLSKMKAAEFDWESKLLFTIVTYDNFYAPGVASRCDFVVQWIEE